MLVVFGHPLQHIQDGAPVDQETSLDVPSQGKACRRLGGGNGKGASVRSEFRLFHLVISYPKKYLDGISSGTGYLRVPVGVRYDAVIRRIRTILDQCLGIELPRFFIDHSEHDLCYIIVLVPFFSDHRYYLHIQVFRSDRIPPVSWDRRSAPR